MSKKLPEGWKRVKLGDVAKVDGGYAFKSSEFVTNGIPIIRINNLDKNGVNIDNEVCYPNDFKQINKYKVEFGDILIGMSGSIGKISIYKDKDIALLNQRVGNVKPLNKEELSKSYLYYFMKSELFIREIFKSANGCIIANISSKDICNVNLNLPPLKEQERIVSILEKAEKAIQKREESNRLLDEYLKSVFIDMFGDPVTNTKGWEKIKLKHAGILERGKSKHRPRNAPELLGGIYPLIQTGDIANSGMYLSEYNQTYSEIGLKQSKMWNKGTLAITIAANIAKTSILGIDACFPDSVVGFIPNQCTNVEFVCLWMTFLQSMIEKNAPESAQKNINLKILGELDIIIPNIELQNKFAKIVHSIEVIKNKQMKSNKELENLFNSLMQKAFNGEL